MHRFFLISFLFIVTITYGQQDQFQLTKSEIFKKEKYKTTILYAKEDLNGDIYVVRNFLKSYSNPKGYYIQHYDKDLNLIKSTQIEVDRNEIKGLYINESSITLLQFQYHYKEKIYAFATLTSSKDEFNFTEKRIFSIDRDKIDKYDHFGIRSEPEFNVFRRNHLGDIKQSKNGEYLAINIFTKEGDTSGMHLIVLNKNFDKVYENQIKNFTSDKEKKRDEVPFLYQDMIVDNINGTVYILGVAPKDGSNKLKRKGEPNYSFLLFKVNENKVNQTVLGDTTKKFIHSMRLLKQQSKIAAVGFYSDKINQIEFNPFNFETGVRLDGMVRYNINSDSLTEEYESFLPFSEEFMLDKYGKVKDKTKAFLLYKSLFMLPNGDVILNAEEFEIFVPDYYTSGNNIYRDIITCRISDAGQLMWARNINKKQAAFSLNNIPYFSYTASIKDNTSYYFLSASDDLKILRKNRVKFDEGNQLYLISITEDGDMDYKKIFFNETFNAEIQVRFGTLINNQDILFQSEVDKDPMLIKIEHTKE